MNKLNPDILSFDDNWKFYMGVPACGEPSRHFWKAGQASGPAARVYNDTSWNPVVLPHDWGMELDYDYTGDVWHGALPINTGRETHSIGFYRKDFDVPESWADRNLTLVFDGVYRQCELWVNGQYVTRNVSGYAGFSVDISDLVFYGEKNNIALRVDASQQEGWFYEGAGVYRHVWLRVFPRVFVDPESVFLHLDGGSDVVCSFKVKNTSDEECADTAEFEIADKYVSGSLAVPAHSEAEIKLTVKLDGYIPWELDAPYLYGCTVSFGAHAYKTRTGLRTFTFDAQKGFILNGKKIKILGSCTHQDFAVVGVALDDDLQYYKMKILKRYGFNGNRTAHNHPAPELLDACDELGIIVMSENRLFGSTPEALSQLERMILTGRNHPSVMLWSLGNEEIIQANDSARRQACTAKRLILGLDPTRPVTYAANNGGNLTGINEVVDVRGVNYLNIGRDLSEIDRYHAQRLGQPVIGSEESSCLATRGVYEQDALRGYVENFDNCGPSYLLGAEALWKEYQKRDFLAGAFVWTGIDYRGEASKQAYITNFGVIDLCGFPKSTAHYFRAMNRPEPYIFVYPHWNRAVPEGTRVLLRIYTNADEVEVSVNGISYGRKKRELYASVDYHVPYAKGVVECTGYIDGKHTISETLRTAYEPQKLSASVERIGNTSFVTVEMLDAYSTPCPEASNRLYFQADGTAVIIGASNGNPSDEDPEKAHDICETYPLKGFRIHENAGNDTYSDQNLTELVGNNDGQRIYRYAKSYVPEDDSAYAVNAGPRRKIGQARCSSGEVMLTVSCDFWLDEKELSYDYLSIGYCVGKVKVTLNDIILYEGQGDGDALKLPAADALRRGENKLTAEIKESAVKTYAIGNGIRLTRSVRTAFSRRLFKNRCLCIVRGSGILNISADGMETLTLMLSAD